MLIEQKTSYAYKLKYLENPTFDKVRGFAKSFIDDLPKELVDELYSQLERGVVQIDSEPQMLVYLYSFGNMHQAKLNKAFENIPEILFDQPGINIIDYGCGQAIGTMCYVDFIRHKGISQKVKRVTLIEPSEICLKRAALHVSKFCPDAEIVTINKEFDELDDEDIVCEEEIPTLHILSNVLDLDFDLERFAELISEQLKGYNQFVCVGPYFGVSSKDRRMEEFCSRLNGEENYSESFDKFELNGGKAWTAQIRCFSVGELEEELSTEVTDEDIENGVEDEYGVVYSRDGKRLLGYNDVCDVLGEYIVKEGTKVICDFAFADRSDYSSGLTNIHLPDSVTHIGEFAFACHCFEHLVIPKNVNYIGGGFIHDNSYNKKFKKLRCNSPYFDIDGDSLYLNDKKILHSYLGTSAHIVIPSNVKSIGKYAFYACYSVLSVLLPNNIEKIEDGAFANCMSLQFINIPFGVQCISNEMFYDCTELRQITIPSSIIKIGDRAFKGCRSLKNLTIPSSVKYIGEEAFDGCSSLEHIVILGEIKDIGKNVFGKKNDDLLVEIFGYSLCISLRQIVVPENIVEMFKKLLPPHLKDKLYYLRQTVDNNDTDDLPF